MIGLVALPLAYEDGVELRSQWELLAGALEKSPSLLDQVKQDLQAAWQAIRPHDAALPAETPWPTLPALRQALDVALKAGGLAPTGG